MPLALLPAGTGNLFARNLGLALGDLEESVRVAFAGVTRGGRCGDRFARAGGRRPQPARLRRHGRDRTGRRDGGGHQCPRQARSSGWLAYVDPIARSIIANRHFPMHYRIDGGRVRSARAHTVIVGNCGTLTANFLLLPNAVIDDGLLDVVVLRPKGLFGWGRVGTRLTVHGLLHKSRFGRRIVQITPELKALNYTQGHQLEVWFSTPQVVELDGDSFGPVMSARLTVRHAELRVCIARSDDPDRSAATSSAATS